MRERNGSHCLTPALRSGASACVAAAESRLTNYERVQAQPGDFYGGWVKTDEIARRQQRAVRYEGLSRSLPEAVPRLRSSHAPIGIRIAVQSHCQLSPTKPLTRSDHATSTWSTRSNVWIV